VFQIKFNKILHVQGCFPQQRAPLLGKKFAFMSSEHKDAAAPNGISIVIGLRLSAKLQLSCSVRVL